MSTSTSHRTQCPHCQKILKLKSEAMFGRRTNCPQCKEKFEVKPMRVKSPPQRTSGDTMQMGADETDVWTNDFTERKSAPSRRSRTRTSKSSPKEEDYGFGETLPQASPRRRSRSTGTSKQARKNNEADDRDRPRRKPKRKQKQPMLPSFVFEFLGWSIGGGIAGLIGALIWAGVAYATGYEIAYVCIGIGGFVGFGTLMGAAVCNESQGFGSGLTAAIIALGAVFLGRALAFYSLNYYTISESFEQAIQQMGFRNFLYIAFSIIAAFMAGTGLWNTD
ncbi:MAG: hypothetical protein KDA65_10820 [Planctomycetaceae bacterium]|nr:hypothetical protein [Planctomycetaceae bacterium]